MAGNIEQNLELEKILATLASLPKTEPVPYPAQQQQIQDPTHGFGALPIDAQNNTYTPPQQPLPFYQPIDPRLLGRPTPPPSQREAPLPKPQDRSSTPLIDPSTITEWKQGLRCVSKIAAQNADFAPSVRKLMKDQEQNVKAWEAGRTRLIDDHRIKRENEQTHRAALSLPGLLDSTPLLRTPEREKEELAQYDAKVYRACKAMVDSQASSLKVLGVPFFGTKPFLIVNSLDNKPNDNTETPANSVKKVTKEQLLELQRKMLNHLMELYGD